MLLCGRVKMTRQTDQTTAHHGSVTRMLLDPPKSQPTHLAPPAAAIRGFGSPDRVITLESQAIPLSAARTVAAGKQLPIWAFCVATVLVAWSFYPTLDWLVGKWYADPSYSHGFLVPFTSAYIVYRKRANITEWFGTPQPMFAAGILVGILLLRGLAGGLLFNQLDAIALLLTITTGVYALGGWKLLKHLSPGLAFLIFLVPLPYELEQNVGGPLKIIATTASTYLLQTLGYPAIATGNVIHIDDVVLGVVDACNGLKMLVTFASFGGGAVLVLKKTRFEKLMIILGIVPIAVITNVLRITTTGMIYTMTQDKGTRDFVHDAAGLMMMPVGLALLALQIWILNRLILKPSHDDSFDRETMAGFRPATASA
jgi:exosortase